MKGASLRITLVCALGGPLLATSVTCALPKRESLCEEGRGTGELFGAVACDLCASRECCDEATACAADAGCAQLMQCQAGCAPTNEAGCFADCQKTIPHDAALAHTLASCVARRCERDGCVLPERRATCAAAGDVPDVFGLYACDLCVRRKACNAATNCAENEACAARIACMSQCTGDDLDPACFDRCRDDDAFGVGDAQLFAEVARQCRAECRIGTAFECVDDYSWPTTRQARVKVTHQALDRTMGNAPFVGLQVTACASQSGACNAVGAPPVAVTDEAGLVVVDVPTANGFDPVDDQIFSGFRGYLRWEREPPDPENWLPTTLQHTRPEYRDRLADEIAPFASGSLLQSLINLVAMERDVEQDLSRGVLVGGIVDCHGTVEFFAPDIAVEVQGADESTEYVFVTADMTFLDFSVTSTTTAGQFVIVNVPAGSPKVVMKHEPSGEIVAETTVNIFPGEITVLAAWPRTK